VAPLVVRVNGQRQINPALAASNIQVIKDTHGKILQLSARDIVRGRLRGMEPLLLIWTSQAVLFPSTLAYN
jgi:hypothetical protein